MGETWYKYALGVKFYLNFLHPFLCWQREKPGPWSISFTLSLQSAEYIAPPGRLSQSVVGVAVRVKVSDGPSNWMDVFALKFAFQQRLPGGSALWQLHWNFHFSPDMYPWISLTSQQCSAIS